MAEKPRSEWSPNYERLNRLADAAETSKSEIPTPADISVGALKPRVELTEGQIAEVKDRLERLPQITEDDRRFDVNNGRHRRAVANHAAPVRAKTERFSPWQRAKNAGAALLVLGASAIGISEVVKGKPSLEGLGSVATAAAENVDNIADKAEKNKIDSIIENSDIVLKVAGKAQVGTSQFLGATGWQGEYGNEILTSAIEGMAENKGIDFDNLQEGTEVYIPVKILE